MSDDPSSLSMFLLSYLYLLSFLFLELLSKNASKILLVALREPLSLPLALLGKAYYLFARTNLDKALEVVSVVLNTRPPCRLYYTYLLFSMGYPTEFIIFITFDTFSFRVFLSD